MTNQELCLKTINKMYDISNEFGGGEYNDEMIYNLQGANECYEYSEEITDKDWIDTLKELEECLAWFLWVKKIFILKSKEPHQIYG